MVLLERVFDDDALGAMFAFFVGLLRHIVSVGIRALDSIIVQRPINLKVKLFDS